MCKPHRSVTALVSVCLALIVAGCSAESSKDSRASKDEGNPTSQLQQSTEMADEKTASPSSQTDGTNIQAGQKKNSEKRVGGVHNRASNQEVTKRRGPVTARVGWAAGGTDEERELEVALEVAPGWHIYAQVPSGSPYPVTSIELELPDDSEAVTDWMKPAGIPSLDNPGAFVFMGTVTFTRSIHLPTDASIGVKVSYQACQGQICNPPDSISLTLD